MEQWLALKIKGQMDGIGCNAVDNPTIVLHGYHSTLATHRTIARRTLWTMEVAEVDRFNGVEERHPPCQRTMHQGRTKVRRTRLQDVTRFFQPYHVYKTKIM